MLLKEWWWRFRFALRLCWRLRSIRRWAWEAAWQGDYHPEYPPFYAADEELSYWADG